MVELVSVSVCITNWRYIVYINVK